jgi:hypothetical protein
MELDAPFHVVADMASELLEDNRNRAMRCINAPPHITIRLMSQHGSHTVYYDYIEALQQTLRLAALLRPQINRSWRSSSLPLRLPTDGNVATAKDVTCFRNDRALKV